MSGHCTFCDMWHSASCCHPGRLLIAQAEADLAAAKEENERLRGGSNPGPNADCTDCDRAMVWQRRDTGISYVGAWMCPNCTMRRAEKAEAELAALKSVTTDCWCHGVHTHDANEDDYATIARLRVLLREAREELDYVQQSPSHGLCASRTGRDLIARIDAVLGGKNA